jgi:hypothetical protein
VGRKRSWPRPGGSSRSPPPLGISRRPRSTFPEPSRSRLTFAGISSSRCIRSRRRRFRCGC